MMKNPISPKIIGIRPSHDTNHGEILTVSPGNSIDHAEPTHGERHNAGTNPALPGVAVGGVAGIELIATSNVVKPRLSNEVVEQGEVKVTGNGEKVAHPDLDQPAGYMPAEGGVGADDSRRGVRAMDSGDLAVVGGTGDVVVVVLLGE